MPSSLSWHYEDFYQAQACRHIAGVDEAGRGCLAGPVVAAAVVVQSRAALPHGVNDSKKLTRTTRRSLYEALVSSKEIAWHVASASVEEIDSLNILRASHLAMKRAIEGLSQAPDWILVDGRHASLLGSRQKGIIGGDAISPSIAAASILAKETRDRMMETLDAEVPHYGFARHKGYATEAHLDSLRKHGPSSHHRRSFAPVRQVILSF